MATQKQIELFTKLTADKDFGQQDVNSLKTQFENLPDKSASKWIEKALALPDKGEVAPPF